MSADHPAPLRDVDADAALVTILEGTATETGADFFAALVQNLAKALHTHGAWVTEYFPQSRRLRALAFWMDGKFVSGYEVEIAGTPCESVIDRAELVHFPDKLVELYPNDPEISQAGAVSYMGVPLLDLQGKILGHMAVVDRRPMPEAPRTLALFKIFAARAAAELQRLQAEAEVKKREEKLGRLVDSAMDAIIEFDGTLRVTRVNPAAVKVLGCAEDQVVGANFIRFLSARSKDRLTALIQDLDARPSGQRYQWIPDGLVAVRADGEEFPAEATLSRFEMGHETYHTVILRNVNERLAAEQRIRSLTVEAECLREEIKALRSVDEVIGQSAALRQTLEHVARVAETDATVLIFGETGTGKELIARRIHAASRRRGQALIKVNCAAIPAALIESEFFGHEQGAFTGATRKREGRFALADGGTIFLDEIGELPVDLQAKLLRVLQEGEFESVGSSKTRKVNVRVLAATNRNLLEAVEAGQFRQDLYYRLNVFPITVPPLRKRGEDITLLANTFARHFAHRMGRTVEPLSEESGRRLMAYDWPGNIRELQNVMERAVITARGGHLNLADVLASPMVRQEREAVVTSSVPVSPRVRTVEELQALERDNILLALESCAGRVSGDKGAAQLLGMNPSTLTSRMKALGIKRPRLVSTDE